MESYCFGKSQQGSIWHGSTNCYQMLLRGYHAQYKQRIVMVFTRETKVQRLFCEIMDCEIEEEKFLKRSVSGKKKVQGIIKEEKEFGVSFNHTTEEITFHFFYGVWNEYGWPQHI